MDSTNGRPAAGGHRLLMTPERERELREELERLRSEGREEIARLLREARAFGDDANNDEHQAVREQEAILEARIASLEEVLARATIVDPAEADGDVALLGSTVTIENLTTGKRASYRIAGAHETIADGMVSAASPMGQALMGARAGETVTAELPNGRTVEVRVLSVEPPSAQVA
jgi:transcription elongation factor GreA